MKVEIMNGPEGVEYVADGVAVFELDHDVLGSVRLSAEPMVPDIDDIVLGCPCS